MPYNPGIAYDGDKYIYGATQQIGSAVINALKEYEDNQKNAAFSDAVMHHLAETPNPATGQPYVPLEALNDYSQQPLKKRIGTAAAAQANAAADTSRALQEQQRRIQQGTLDLARQKFADESQPFSASDQWVGGTHVIETEPGRFQIDPTQGSGSAAADNFEPDAAKVEEMRQIGKIWAPMGPHQGQWVDDPNSWVNSQQLTPIKDPRDPTGQKIVGFQQPNGSVRYFPSTNMADAIAALAANAQKPGAAGGRGAEAPPTLTATPAVTPAPTLAPVAPQGARVMQDGQGGYVPGRRYAGKRYLGGDPNDANNWQQN